MKKSIDEQVRITFEDFERDGTCVFPYSEAVHKDLEARIASGADIVRPLAHLYARGSWWRGLCPDQRALAVMRALSQMHGDWVFCGASAAMAHGLSVSYRHLDPIRVLSPSGSKWYYERRVRTRHNSLEGEVGAFVERIPATSLRQTLLDCARELPFRDAVAVVDSALHKGSTSKEELERFFSSKRRLPGLVRAREVLAFADARSGSGGESIARAAMYELGFAAPDLQREFRDPLSGKVYYADFFWDLGDGKTIIGELDGGEKYVNPSMTGGRDALEVMRDERLRESRLTACASAIVRFSPKIVADDYEFNRLLASFGVPKDHEPTIDVPEFPSWMAEYL